MFLYEKEEIINKTIKDLIPDVFVNHFSEGIKKFINIGRPVLGDIVELNGKRSNGEKFEIELSFSRWKYEKEYEYTLIIREITERKRQEDELKSAKDELEKRVEERTSEVRSLIDQSTLPILVFDKEGVILDENFEFGKIKTTVFNYSDEKLNLKSLIKNADYYKLLKNLFSGGISFTTKPLFFDNELSDESLTEIILIFHFYAIKNDQNKVIKAVCVVEDITSGIKAEETRQKLEWQKHHNKVFLEKLEEERLRISRELHDQIGPMLFSSKLNLEVFSKNKEKDFNRIEDSRRLITIAGEELKNIIKSLQPSVLRSYGLISAVKLLLKDLEEKNGIVQNFNFEQEYINFKNLQIELNIYRIIQEALNNIKKHAEATKVDLDFFLGEDLFSVCIKDNGRGFRNEDIQIEEEYFSFGLKNMRERTELMSGNFSIESELNKGTTIIIDLPGDLIDAKN